MKTGYVVLFAAAAVAVSSCASLASLPVTGGLLAPGAEARYAPLIGEIEQMARQTMSRNRIPGLSIVLADSHGPIWECGFGFADDARKVRVDPATIFSIQSMSKTLTAVGVLSAMYDGLLDLDKPISSYLPDFRVQSIFEERPLDRITLRHLLTHTAGFTHEAPVGNNNDPGQPTFDEHVASIQDTWLMFRVGEQYHYSNLGIDLAGYILQKVAGRPFVDYMRDKVFSPLGMTRTTMDPSVISGDANRAIGHEGGSARVPVIEPMTAAGGAYASAHDLGTFLTFMLRKGRPAGQILSAAEFVQMETTPNYGAYGLGVAIGRRQDDLFFEHGGGGYGFLSYMAWYPTLDIGIAVLTNSSKHDSAHLALAAEIVDRLVEANVVEKSYSLTHLPVCRIELGKVKDDSWYFDAHPEKTAWKPEWQKYLGSYTLSGNAPLLWWASLAVSMGFPRSTFVKVNRDGDGMTIDGEALLEQEPGLFFSKTGEALDFRGVQPTWGNIKLHKR